jgi:hypothetical protein
MPYSECYMFLTVVLAGAVVVNVALVYGNPGPADSYMRTSQLYEIWAIMLGLLIFWMMVSVTL